MPGHEAERNPKRWLYFAAGTLIVIALMAGALFYLRPTNIVVMTTGAKDGAYEAFGLQYKAILARSGVELRLLPSGGSLENLKRLNDPRSGVTVGFVDGGLTNESESPDLNSLGSAFYEPLWFFSRGIPDVRLESLRGRKVAIGPEGSATRLVAERLLALNGVDRGIAQMMPLSAAESSDALLRGDIDAAFMVAPWDTPAVRRLLASSAVELVSFPSADAYVALFPFLTKLTVPAGVGDLATNRPPVDVEVLALKASLVVRKDLDSALRYLLLDAAAQIHSAPGIFQKAGQFPAAEQVDLPLSDDAQQFFKSGRPLLQRLLPFWLAGIMGKALFVLIPVVGILYPLARFAPALFAWSMRRRIFRFYGELKLIELELESGRGDHGEMVERLGRLEQRVNQLRVPTMYAQFLYVLRSHVALIHAKLEHVRERSQEQRRRRS
jgi:TRAP transporter TAXI family solute receptor